MKATRELSITRKFLLVLNQTPHPSPLPKGEGLGVRGIAYFILHNSSLILSHGRPKFRL